MDIHASYKISLKMLEEQSSYLQALARKENSNTERASLSRHDIELLRRDACTILQELWGPKTIDNAKNRELGH